MSKDAQINPMELISGIGATGSALKDAFESKQASSCECASKRLDSCELNQQAYRNMLQSDSYSFEEKAQIHAWIVDEDERMERIDVEHFAAARELLSGIVVVSTIVAALGFSAYNPEAAQKCLKAAARTLPRLIVKDAIS